MNLHLPVRIPTPQPLLFLLPCSGGHRRLDNFFYALSSRYLTFRLTFPRCAGPLLELKRDSHKLSIDSPLRLSVPPHFDEGRVSYPPSLFSSFPIFCFLEMLLTRLTNGPIFASPPKPIANSLANSVFLSLLPLFSLTDGVT